MATVAITGIGGQDGAYLAQLCLQRGDTVVGLIRPGRDLEATPVAAMGLLDRIRTIGLDLCDLAAVRDLVGRSEPDLIVNLAAESSVARSFEQPLEAFLTNAQIPLTLLEAIRQTRPQTRFIQASSAEIFGEADGLCDEDTPIRPCNPYGVGKASAHQAVQLYRRAYGLFAANAILFAHESPHRGAGFVTQKIVRQLRAVRDGEAPHLALGALDAQRDWGYAGDYMAGVLLMAGAETPDDFVLATGQARSVRDFVGAAALHYGFDLEWRGAGLEEQAVDRRTGQTVVVVDPAFFRPVDPRCIRGSPARIESRLGWRRTVDFAQLVGLMAAAAETSAHT